MAFAAADAETWSADRLRTATDAAGVALWCWNVDTNEIAMDARSRALWDLPISPLSLDLLLARIYPPDQREWKQRLEVARSRPGPYAMDFRIQQGHQVRWISARGLGADRGVVGSSLFGTFMDVTERRQADEARDLLATEMSHRVKNLFAIARSLTSIAARSAATTAEMAEDLTQRLTTLGRAHDLIRRDTASMSQGRASLGELFESFLTAYDEAEAAGDKIRVTLPDIVIGETAITALALIAHELATNSAKYGAMSVAGGTLDLSGVIDDHFVSIVWAEGGGPAVAAPNGPGGFGTRLVGQCVRGQLGGTVAYDWRATGLVVRMRLHRERLGV